MLEYQRVIAEINLDNIAYNMQNIRKRIPESTKILAVVKADAYGHGAVDTAKVCLYNGADQLGVATCDEAVTLRRNNIFVPILILGYTIEKQISDVIENDITQAVFNFETARCISDTAVKMGKTALIHIKFDTGMGRIGFKPNDESVEEIMKISRLPNIKITGAFSHFATADEADKTFTNTQFERFIYVTDKMRKNGLDFIRHIANSGAICDLIQYRLDMVRAGIIIYGMYPSEQVEKTVALKPAMSLKTHISCIKQVDEGVSISYGRHFFTKRKSVIATVPVGYADGYSRIMSSKARVIVGGEYAPQVGNICMDQFMIDITDIKGVSVGDEVILMGESGEKAVYCEELADLQGTINYEVVCSVGKRVPRVYIRNGQVIKTVAYK